MDLDDVLREVGGFSRYQKLCVVLCFSTLFVSSSLIQASVLYSAIPGYRCKVELENVLSNTSCNGTSALDNILKQSEDYSSCDNVELVRNVSNDKCSWMATSNVSGCSRGFVYSKEFYQETTISEWDLICDRQILDAVANSLFFFGCFLGSILQGIISDWFGRKVGMVIFGYGMIIAHLGLALSHEFWLFLIFRVLTGVGSVANSLGCYTYGFEIIDFETRKIIVPVAAMLTSISHIVLPGLQYGLSHWRHFTYAYLIISIPGLIGVIFLPESPRWLLANGKENQARKIVEKIAKSNGEFLQDRTWSHFIKTYNSLITNAEKGKRYTMLDLFRRPLMSIMSVIIINGWFAVNLVFFGLILNGSNLFGDPLLNTMLNGCVETLAALMFIVMQLRKVKSRYIAFIAYFFAGVACLLSIMQGYENTRTVGVVMAIVGKMFSTLAFSVIYYISLDTYPVKIRSVALGMGSTVARIAGMITPFVLFAQFTALWITPTIFGVLSIFTAFSFLALPDGNVKALNPSLDDTERFYAEQMKLCVRIFRIKPPVVSVDKGHVNGGIEHEFNVRVSELPQDDTVGTRL